MYARFSKVALVWAVAFFVTLVALNNLMDYDSNYQFVKHVLKMDTTFPDNKVMWRAIDSAAVHHFAYAMIIATQIIIAALCWLGGFNLCRAMHDAEKFQRVKILAILGLTLGIILYFFGFITIGGEWFLMWQSEIWNGQQSAFRIVAVLGITLLFLNQKEN